MMKARFSLAALLFLFVALPFSAWGAVSFGPPGGIEHRSKYISPPAAAIDDEGRVYVAWFEEEKDVNSLYLAVSGDGGKTFSPEVRVNGPDEAPSSVHDAPGIALGPKGEVYLAWSAKRAEGEFSSDLRFAASTDSGRSFSPSVKVNDNANPASASFASIAAGEDGIVYAAWLDSREKGTKGTATYAAYSKDNGRHFGKNALIGYDSCPCCRTAVAVGRDNSLYVVWRKVFPGNIREMVISRSTDAAKVEFTSPVIVGMDNWEISGCPHRGSSVIAGDDGEVLVSWYAEVEGEPGVFIAKSNDGKAFLKERIESKRSAFPDNVVAAARGGELLLAWQEITPVLSNVVFEARKGAEKIRVQLNTDVRKATNPVISVNRKGDVLVAWQKMDMRAAKTMVAVGR